MELCSLITCLYRPGHLPIARLKFENEFEFQTTVFYFVYRQLPPPLALTIKPSLHWTVKKISHRTAFKIQNREANLRYIKVRLLYRVFEYWICEEIFSAASVIFSAICNFDSTHWNEMCFTTHASTTRRRIVFWNWLHFSRSKTYWPFEDHH
jgi:hypothetical protein